MLSGAIIIEMATLTFSPLKSKMGLCFGEISMSGAHLTE
jgi:hypothetical protein